MKVAQLAFSLSNRAGGIFEILLGQSHALRNLGVGVQALGPRTDGGWRMADGGWRMADGGWRMADGGPVEYPEDSTGERWRMAE